MFFSFASIKNTIRLSAYAYISTYDIRQPNAHVCLQIYASEDAACNLLMGETAANRLLSLSRLQCTGCRLEAIIFNQSV